jgi:hypothetical protein
MQAKALETYYLHVYDVEYGSWVDMKLGSPVSPLLLEAMNLILRKDGILAFIGQRSEFGHYLSKLKNETDKDFRHCWTSLPASTIMSMLGLCQCVENPRKPVLVFYGSPLTIALAYNLQMTKLPCESFLPSPKVMGLTNDNCYVLEIEDLAGIGVVNRLVINASEHYEALSYLGKDEESYATNELASHHVDAQRD